MLAFSRGGIDFRDSSGTLTRTIKTGRYVPAHISFAEDHSLWSFGYQLDAADASRPDQKGYMTVRKYLANGNEAGAYLPRSLFPPGLEPADAGWQRSSSITVAHDRVGLWATSGESGDQTEWVELDLNGNLWAGGGSINSLGTQRQLLQRTAICSFRTANRKQRLIGFTR